MKTLEEIIIEEHKSICDSYCGDDSILDQPQTKHTLKQIQQLIKDSLPEKQIVEQRPYTKKLERRAYNEAIDTITEALKAKGLL